MRIGKSIQSIRRYWDFLWWFFFLQPVDWLASRHRSANRSSTILVVHPCRIGDTVLWLDAARGLRELYPKPAHRIVLLAEIATATLMRSQPYFDNVMELDRARFFRNPRYRWQTLRRIAGEGFSVALNPAEWPDAYVADSIMGACGAAEALGWSLRRRFASVAEGLMMAWRRRKYSRLLPMPMEVRGMLERSAYFLRALGHPSFEPCAPKLKFDRNVEMPAESTPYYVLCPGAWDPLRRWPCERFAAVAADIFAATGMRGVICGSTKEKQLATAICNLVGAPLRDLTGALSLEQFAQFAGRASLVIANDSGALHVAAASGAPTLCIVGGGMFGASMPYHVAAWEGQSLPRAIYHRMDCYGCNWRCQFKALWGDAAPCVARVEVEEVTAAALAILASPRLRNEDTSRFGSTTGCEESSDSRSERGSCR